MLDCNHTCVPYDYVYMYIHVHVESISHKSLNLGYCGVNLRDCMCLTCSAVDLGLFEQCIAYSVDSPQKQCFINKKIHVQYKSAP